MTDEAQRLYQQYQDCVFQIRVIDLATGKKSVIGSGFQISAAGHVVTNYHVVSPAVHNPEKYRVEFLSHDQKTWPLEILTIDVLHDLAIVKHAVGTERHFELGSSPLEKGAKIFSMGNPYDIGMSIVEGTYNGLMEKALYRKIHFSGSLNPGMSGGPALNHEGKVVGVNVSTYGNQISFLVPVEYLLPVYENLVNKTSAPLKNWSMDIQRQILESQNQIIDGLLASSWESLPFGDKAKVPGEISHLFKCWGNSKNEEEKLFTWSELNCSSQDFLFLSSSLWSGQIGYKYIWLTSRGLNVARFYNLYEQWFSNNDEFQNASKEDVSNFECNSSFVRVAGQDWKVATCARRYTKYPQLYDVCLNMATVKMWDKGLLIEVDMLGVSQAKALAFLKKFMGDIQWQK